MKKIAYITTLALSLSSLNALEFGSMGNRSFGMGGAGVALKQSVWGLYYNPALIAAEPAKHAKIGYSLEFGFRDNGLFNMFGQITNDQITNIDQFNKALKSSGNVTSQNGIAVQILPIAQKHNLSVGYFASLYGSLGGYGQVTAGNNQIPDMNTAGLQVNAFFLNEIPIAYAYNFETIAGDIAIGVAAKLMISQSALNKQSLSSNMLESLTNSFGVTFNRSDANFSFDVGLNYTPNILNKTLAVGLVGRNLTAPGFYMSDGSILRVLPQVRLGVAYDPLRFLTLAMDIDLTNNPLIPSGYGTPYSQMIGGGIRLHANKLENLDFRVGIAKDMRHASGAIFTGGVGFGLFDLSFQVGTATTDAGSSGISIPKYMAFKLGGQLNF